MLFYCQQFWFFPLKVCKNVKEIWSLLYYCTFWSHNVTIIFFSINFQMQLSWVDIGLSHFLIICIVWQEIDFFLFFPCLHFCIVLWGIHLITGEFFCNVNIFWCFVSLLFPYSDQETVSLDARHDHQHNRHDHCMVITLKLFIHIIQMYRCIFLNNLGWHYPISVITTRNSRQFKSTWNHNKKMVHDCFISKSNFPQLKLSALK